MPNWKTMLAILIPPALLAAGAYLAVPHAALPWWQVIAGAVVAAAYGAWQRYQPPPSGGSGTVGVAASLVVGALPGLLLCGFLALACVVPGCWPPVPDSPHVIDCRARYRACVDQFPRGPENDPAFLACMARVDADCLPGGAAEAR